MFKCSQSSAQSLIFDTPLATHKAILTTMNSATHPQRAHGMKKPQRFPREKKNHKAPGGRGRERGVSLISIEFDDPWHLASLTKLETKYARNRGGARC